MAWRISGGTTREFVCRQDRDGLLWRVFIAEVEQSGPFSPFPSLVRIITLLTGSSATLHYGVHAPVRLGTLQPHHFNCDGETWCMLHKGCVSAFDVIYDPRRFVLDVRVLSARGATSAREQVLLAYAVTPANLAAPERLVLGAADSMQQKGDFLPALESIAAPFGCKA